MRHLIFAFEEIQVSALGRGEKRASTLDSGDLSIPRHVHPHFPILEPAENGILTLSVKGKRGGPNPRGQKSLRLLT